MPKTETLVIPLGTGGFFPSKMRQTAAYLVRRGESALLLDAGTGVARLLQPEIRAHIEGVKQLHLMLSHYHLDHLVGLTWLVKLWNRPLHVVAPTHPLVDSSPSVALSRITEPPLFGLALEKYPFPVRVTAIQEEADIQVDDFQITIKKQQHSGGSVGFRLDNTLAYVTDTDPRQDHMAILSGVALALIDAMFDTREYLELGGSDSRQLDHGSATNVAALAKVSGVHRLGLIHINPTYDAARCEQMLQDSRAAFEATQLLVEGEPLHI